MTKTFKQIAEIIESGKTVNAREKQAWGYGTPRYSHTVEIDGETFEVKAVSWNKILSEFAAKVERVNEYGNNRYIHYEITAK